MSNTEKKTTEPVTQGHQSNWRPILIGISAIAALLIVLQATGIFKTINSSRDATSIDMNSPDYQNRPMQMRRPEQPNPQVDATLQEIADEFKGPVFSDIHSANAQKGWGLSDDQAKFYDDMRKVYGKKSPNWLTAVRGAYDTYQTVQSVFGGSSDVSAVLKDEKRTPQIFQQLKDLYGLPTQSSELLAKNGANKVSDWARYIESMKK